MITLGPTLLPFLLGSAYVLFRYNSFKWLPTILFLLVCAIMQMIVNVRDSMKTFDNEENYDVQNKPKNAYFKINKESGFKSTQRIYYSLMVIGVILAIWLVLITNWVVLLLGLISMLVGYFYTSRPFPIANNPSGEFFSGFTMGYIITLASALINLPMSAYTWNIFWETFLVAGIAIFSIANIMLANNICDVKTDAEVKRFTLPHYLGKKKSLALFVINYVLGYALLIVSIFMQLLPYTMLILVISVLWVIPNTIKFCRVQSKTKTFILADINELSFVGLSLVGIILYLVF